MHDWVSRRIGIWQFAVIVLFLVLSAIQADKPLNLDNADLPVWAKAVADTGEPLAYRGELRPHDLFVYHTPLYVYTLGAWIKIFGYGPPQIRMFGALCALLFGFVSLQFIRTLYGSEARREVSLYFWPFFLLNPYALQCASIADIDTTIYGPLLCAYLLSIFTLLWSGGQPRTRVPAIRDLALPAVLLCLCFWAKLTTVLLFLIAPLFIFLFRYGWATAVRLWLAVSAMGVGLFVATFLAWCTALGIGYTTHLHWLTSYTATAGANRLLAYWLTFDDMLPFTLKWTGAAPWLAAIALLAVSLRYVRHKDERPRCMLVLLGLPLAGAVYYIMLRHTFGQAPYKYDFVFWGLICLALPVLIASRGRPFDWRSDPRADAAETSSLPLRAWPQWFAASALTFLVVLLASERFLQDKEIRADGPLLWHYSVYWLLPPLLAGLVVLLFRSRRAVYVTLLSLLLFTVALDTGICIYQARAPFSTTYNYGQSGITDTAAYIRLTTEPGDAVLCMKDLGPMLDRPYYESYGYLYGGPKSTADGEQTIAKKVKLAVFTEQIGEDQLVINDEMRRWVGDHCTLIKSFGNYRIYLVRK